MAEAAIAKLDTPYSTEWMKIADRTSVISMLWYDTSLRYLETCRARQMRALPHSVVWCFPELQTVEAESHSGRSIVTLKRPIKSWELQEYWLLLYDMFT